MVGVVVSLIRRSLTNGERTMGLESTLPVVEDGSGHSEGRRVVVCEGESAVGDQGLVGGDAEDEAEVEGRVVEAEGTVGAEEDLLGEGLDGGVAGAVCALALDAVQQQVERLVGPEEERPVQD